MEMGLCPVRGGSWHLSWETLLPGTEPGMEIESTTQDSAGGVSSEIL